MNEMNVSWVKSLKARGFSGLSRLMAIFSFCVAGVMAFSSLSMATGLFILLLHPTWGKTGIIGAFIHGASEDASSAPVAGNFLIAFKNLLAIAISFLPIGILAFGLYQAGYCFLELSRGRYFTPQTVNALRNFACAGLAYVILLPCLPLMLSVFVNTLPITFQEGYAIGSRTQFSYFLIAIYAFTLAIIAALMTKASAIAEDNAQII